MKASRVHSAEDTAGPLAWAAAWRAHQDAAASGDLLVVRAGAQGRLLVAVIDGLGHGAGAAEASRTIAAALDRDESLLAPFGDLFHRAHEASQRTRGAAMTLMRFERADAVEWAGVGNVEAVALMPGRKERPFLRSGIVGLRTPAVRMSRVVLAGAQLVVAATDGIDAAFADGNALYARVHTPLTELATSLVLLHGNPRDDALVFVARPSTT